MERVFVMSENELHEHSIERLMPGFLLHLEVECRFARESLIKYRDCMTQVRKIFGDGSITSFTKNDLLQLKANLMGRNLSVNRQVSILLVFKRFLKFAAEEVGLPSMLPETVLIPRRPRKEVGYLTVEEVERFVASIRLRTGEGHVYAHGLRFRALVEVLMGTAMRISEVLSLDRRQVDFTRKEAKILGKGGKERIVFFTERSLHWICEYLKSRDDEHMALFVTNVLSKQEARHDSIDISPQQISVLPVTLHPDADLFLIPCFRKFHCVLHLPFSQLLRSFNFGPRDRCHNQKHYPGCHWDWPIAGE
jgi:site-specific recombinase XerD